MNMSEKWLVVWRSPRLAPSVVFRVLQGFALLLVCLQLLAACGGGSNPPPTVVLRGIIYDDLIEGATVTISSLTMNVVLATVVTGPSGEFTTPPIAEANLVGGWKVIKAACNGSWATSHCVLPGAADA